MPNGRGCSASARLRPTRASLPISTGSGRSRRRGKYAIVDSATQRLLMFENGGMVDSMKVVVGDKKKLGLPTPMIASIMYYVVHNPYWNVPHHLVRKTVAPGVIEQGTGLSQGARLRSDEGLERRVRSDRSEVGRLESGQGRHGPGPRPAEAERRQFDGRPEISVQQSGGHLPPRHADAQLFQPRQPRQEQRLRPARGRAPLRPLAARARAGDAERRRRSSSSR